VYASTIICSVGATCEEEREKEEGKNEEEEKKENVEEERKTNAKEKMKRFVQ